MNYEGYENSRELSRHDSDKSLTSRTSSHSNLTKKMPLQQHNSKTILTDEDIMHKSSGKRKYSYEFLLVIHKSITFNLLIQF